MTDITHLPEAEEEEAERVLLTCILDHFALGGYPCATCVASLLINTYAKFLQCSGVDQKTGNRFMLQLAFGAAELAGVEGQEIAITAEAETRH